MSDVIGTGWAFPVGLDPRQRVALARGAQDIEQAITMILLTPKGQRQRRPEFGCQIHDLIFAPNDGTTAGLAEYYVSEALAMWEPRITVRNVRAEPDPVQAECLQITIQYDIKATHDRRALVFPFYRIPGE
jgi:uncharacterized protein